MMRFIINYVRSLLCQHDWELIGRVMHENVNGRKKLIYTYRCKKCGYVQRVRL